MIEVGEPSPPADPKRAQASEVTRVHTRLLRLALGIEEARAYWASVDPSVSPGNRALAAFEQRWFGAKSLDRVKTLLPYLAVRYDAFPEALEVLRRWRPMGPVTRQVICHWHVQLTDPIYRRFTGELLLERRAIEGARVDRSLVARWLRRSWPDRWAEATIRQFASKLLSAACEGGLLTPRREPCALVFPKVDGLGIGYLLYLLRGLRHEGSLTENPYLASVGLGGGGLGQRVGTVPGVAIRRMGHLVEIDWAYSTLTAWAEATL